MISYMWNQKKNRQTTQKQTHRYKEQTVDCQVGGGWRLGEKGEGIKKYKLAVTK